MKTLGHRQQRRGFCTFPPQPLAQRFPRNVRTLSVPEADDIYERAFGGIQADGYPISNL
jgi:hypothetical protein